VRTHHNHAHIANNEHRDGAEADEQPYVRAAREDQRLKRLHTFSAAELRFLPLWLTVSKSTADAVLHWHNSELGRLPGAEDEPAEPPLKKVRTDHRTWMSSVLATTAGAAFDGDFRVRVPKAAVPECTTAELRVHFTDPVWLVQELLLDRGLHDR
jgi:hypothetical protein